jgi:hypothetical protein
MLPVIMGVNRVSVVVDCCAAIGKSSAKEMYSAGPGAAIEERKQDITIWGSPSMWRKRRGWHAILMRILLDFYSICLFTISCDGPPGFLRA